MKLLTKSIETKLRKNAAAMSVTGTGGTDHKPVVKFFNPCGSATWLITEIDANNIMFGLCDLGTGCPELGYVCLSDLTNIRLPFGLGIERDLAFKADKTISEYAAAANEKGRIEA